MLVPWARHDLGKAIGYVYASERIEFLEPSKTRALCNQLDGSAGLRRLFLSADLVRNLDVFVQHCNEHLQNND